MLVLAGVELIFFTVAGKGLCAGNSVDNTGMFSLLLSSAYTESRPFLLLTAPHQQGGWGCTKSWEDTQLGQLTPTDQRDTAYHMMSCSAYKAGRRQGGRSEWWRLSSQVTIMRDGALLSWRWLNTCLLMGSSEWIPCFALLVCTAFALLLSCLYLNPRVFSLLLFWFSPPSHRGGVSERLCGA